MKLFFQGAEKTIKIRRENPNNLIDNNFFERAMLNLPESFEHLNDEPFPNSVIIDRVNFQSEFASKNVSECFKILKELLTEYPDCKKETRDKLANTELDKELQESLLKK